MYMVTTSTCIWYLHWISKARLSLDKTHVLFIFQVTVVQIDTKNHMLASSFIFMFISVTYYFMFIISSFSFMFLSFVYYFLFNICVYWMLSYIFNVVVKSYAFFKSCWNYIECTFSLFFFFLKELELVYNCSWE